jgi:hypothetical protein
VAGIAGSYYVLNKATTEKDEDGRRTPTRTSKASIRFLQNDNLVIVMTVDATPDKCAGILRLPRHKKLYYYSVDWVPFNHFSKQSSEQKPDKFEMLNALIATLAFKSYMEAYQHSYRRILLQTDNSFASLKEGRQRKDPTNRKNFGRITMEMSCLGIPYEWNQVGIWEDVDMWNANQLSRNSSEPPFRQPVYGNYREKIDISDDVRKICVAISKEQE